MSIDLEKAYERVPIEEQWFCMRQSVVTEKYVRVVQDMYESSETEVRCAVGVRGVQGGGGTASRIVSQSFSFTLVMDRLTNDVRQDSP